MPYSATKSEIDALTVVVARFYELILADSRISHFFDDIDTTTLVRKQVWFFASVLSGDNKGTLDYMRNSHKQLVRKKDLNDQHFDATMECLTTALDENQVDVDTRSKILMAANGLRDTVLNRDI